MIVIKPHHLIDIIKLYGAGVEHFVPDELFQHDFYKVANSIIENLDTPLQFTVHGDDICRPCNRFKDSRCTDSLDGISGYCCKDTYNQELDSRLINQLELDGNTIYTARQFIEKLSKDRYIIFHVWSEEDNALTEKRNKLFQQGLKKLMAGGKIMELIRITHENLETEHICCAISNNKDCQVMSKKAWLKERLDEGLVFLKGNVRGKCFIEYIPAEYAWAPIEANGYMYIDCLWVSGQFKGQGYSNLLMEECIRDSKAKGKKGLVILSSKKKRGFLSDPDYMAHKGFETVDTADPYFELLYLPFEKSVEKPCFKSSVKEPNPDNIPHGFSLYYTSQCPFTAKYVPILEDMAKKRNADFQAIPIVTTQQAQNAPTPFTTFSLFYQGEFITHEILSEKKFEKILAERGL